MANITVHGFKEVYLEVEDTKYAVSSAVMILEENAVPNMRIVIDPAHEYFDGGIGSFGGLDATEATLSSIIQWHEKFQIWAVEKKEAAFHMIVTTKDDPNLPGDGDGEDQILDLKKWIITGAGITGASASGNFALEIELSHPISAADDAPAVLSGFKQMAAFKPTHSNNWEDIPKAFADIMKRYATFNRSLTDEGLWGSAPQGCRDIIPAEDQIREKLVALCKHAGEVIAKRLIWNTADYAVSYKKWPLAECLAPMLEQVKLALSDSITGNSEATPFEILANNIMPQWGVVMVPTYWKEALEMRPYSPWLEHQIKIVSTDVSDIMMPGVDPSPLAGIIENHQEVASDGTWSVYLKQGGENGFIADEIAYMPPAMASPGYTHGGRVLHYAPPGWLLIACSKDAGSRGDINSSGPGNSIYKRPTPADNGVTDTSGIEIASADQYDRLSRLRSGIWTHCKYTFMAKFRQKVETQLTCRLLITSPLSNLDDNRIAPGHVIQLIDSNIAASQSQPVFDFYCRGVVHSMDCQRGSAYTELTGSYVRPIGAFEGVVQSGDLNPLYE